MKKKVLFLIHALGAGGAEKILVNIANGMDKEKFDVTIMTVVNTGIFREYIGEGVKYKYLFTFPFNKKYKNAKKDNNIDIKNENPGNVLNKSDLKIQMIAKLYTWFWKVVPIKLFYRIMIREKYDVEIAFLEGICAKIISGSTNEDSRKISWIHVDMLNHEKSKAVFKNYDDEKKCYENFDQVVCVSNTVREQFLKKFDYREDKVIVKYNPIDKDDIVLKSKEDVKDIIKPDKFVFCTIGRLVTQKGYDRLLKVHKNLIDEGLDYELWIIGEGNKRPNLERYIVENNLEQSVKLLGFKSNPYKYLNMADAFVCSSRAEGFSTVASEAVVLKKPIVTVDCSGMNELLGTNSEYGLITENKEEDLFIGMKTMLTDRDLYNKYKKNIAKRKQMFDYGQAVKSIEELC